MAKHTYTAYHNPSSDAQAPSRVEADNPFDLLVRLLEKYGDGLSREWVALHVEFEEALMRARARDAMMDSKLRIRK